MRTLACLAPIVASAALLAGCGWSQSPIGTPGAMPQGAPLAKHGGSRMLPEANASGLLYATAKSSDYVYEMTYPKIELVHRLGPFSGPPQALCADSSAVYVLVRGAGYSQGSKIYVYKHGATTETRVLHGSFGNRRCAVDPTSGDLAVASSYGALTIYRHSRGRPHVYKLGYPGTCDVAYGADGKLYFLTGGCAGLAILDHGQWNFITYDQSVGYPLSIQWHHGLIVATTVSRGWPKNYHQNVFLIQPEASYKAHVQTIVLGRSAREEPNKTTASSAVGDMIVAPDHDLGALDVWRLPQGGDPRQFARVKSIDGNFTNLVISTGS